MVVQDTEENQLLTRQLEEAKAITAFMQSPVWLWLKARLEAVRPRLMVYATAPDKKRDDRMIAIGKLALVEEILSRPGILADLERRYQAMLNEAPAPVERAVGGGYASPGVL